jgi:hypothetical protein
MVKPDVRYPRRACTLLFSKTWSPHYQISFNSAGEITMSAEEAGLTVKGSGNENTRMANPSASGKGRFAQPFHIGCSRRALPELESTGALYSLSRHC